MIVESGAGERPPRSARLAPAADVAFADLPRRGRGGRATVLPDPRHRRARPAHRDRRAAVGRHRAGRPHRHLSVARSSAAAKGSSPAVRRRSTRTAGWSTSAASGYRSAGRRPARDRPLDDRVEIDDIGRVRAILWAPLRPRVRGHVSGPDGRRQRADAAAARDRPRPRPRAALSGQRRRPPPRPLGRRDRRVFAVRQRLPVLRAGHRLGAGDVLSLSAVAQAARMAPARARSGPRWGPESGALVSYRHALTGARRAHPLVDLSSHGFSFPPGRQRRGAVARAAAQGRPDPPRRAGLQAPGVAIRSVSPSRVSAEMRPCPIARPISCASS